MNLDFGEFSIPKVFFTFNHEVFSFTYFLSRYRLTFFDAEKAFGMGQYTAYTGVSAVVDGRRRHFIPNAF